MLIHSRNRHQISVVGKPLKLPALRAVVTAPTAVKTSVLYPAFPFVPIQAAKPVQIVCANVSVAPINQPAFSAPYSITNLRVRTAKSCLQL